MAETISIRPMIFADVETCACIMAATPLWTRYGVTLESAKARLGKAVVAGESLFVGETVGQVVGFAWGVERGAFARSGYIPLIGVSPDFTGRGLGARLLSYAEAFLGQSSPDVFLTVSDFNEAAQRFYRRQGYKQVGALPDYVLEGVTELIYWKRLDFSTTEPGIENVAQTIPEEIESQNG